MARPMDLSAFETATNAIVIAITSSTSAVTTTLQVPGMKLFALLSVIVIAWMGLKLALEAGVITDIAGELMNKLLFIGIAYWFMNQYDEIFKVALMGSLDGIAGLVNPDMQSVNPGTAIVHGVSSLLQGIFAIGKGVTSWIQTEVDAAISGHIGYIPGSKAYAYLAVFIGNFFQIALLIISAALIFVSIMIYFVMAMMSIIMANLALAVGPIFIPWLLLPVASWVFDGWLKFLIVAGLYKVVGAVLILMTSSAMTEVSHMITRMIGSLASGDTSGEGWGQFLVMCIALTAFAFTIAYMMAQLPSIAQGLVSGGGAISMRGMLTGAKQAGKSASTTVGKGYQDGAAALKAASPAMMRGASAAGYAAMRGASAAGSAVMRGASAAGSAAMRGASKAANTIAQAVGKLGKK